MNERWYDPALIQQIDYVSFASQQKNLYGPLPPLRAPHKYAYVVCG